MNVPENRSPFTDRFHFWFFIIEQIKDEGIPLNILHDDIIYPKLFNNSSSPTRRFQANTGIRTIENTIRNCHSPYTAWHFTTNNYPSMTGKHNTISYRYIFTCLSIFPSISITPRFNCNTIIPHTNKTIRNTHIPARRRVYSIRIGTFWVFWRVIYRHSMHCYIITKSRIYGPKRRIDNFHILYQHIVTFIKLNKRRPKHTTL